MIATARTQERRATVQGEVQRVVEVVVEIRAGADHEVDQSAVHELDHAAAESGGRQRTGNRQADRRVVLRRQHLVGEDVAGFGETPGVECLEPAFDQVPNFRAAAWPVIFDGLAFKVIFASLARGSGRAMRHSCSPP